MRRLQSVASSALCKQSRASLRFKLINNMHKKGAVKPKGFNSTLFVFIPFLRGGKPHRIFLPLKIRVQRRPASMKYYP